MRVQRHTRNHPCPVCGGYDAQPRGGGRRCGGFTSGDGSYAHCSRIACGEVELGGTYAHRLDGTCRCGTTHGAVVIESAPEPAVVDHVATWLSLAQRSFVGERYLQRRGIDPHELRERSAVRYHPRHGSPALPLRDLATGDVVGVQFRRTDDGEPKVSTARGSRCAGAALHGKLADLDPDGVDVAIVVEGFADVLAATLAWPGCAVYGAAGAGQLAAVTGRVASRVRECRGWLLLVPHFDDDGIAAGRAARRAAEGAGLVLDRDLHLVDLGAHNDLADAWLAGWRWQWPESRRNV